MHIFTVTSLLNENKAINNNKNNNPRFKNSLGDLNADQNTNPPNPPSPPSPSHPPNPRFKDGRSISVGLSGFFKQVGCLTTFFRLYDAQNSSK